MDEISCGGTLWRRSRRLQGWLLSPFGSTVTTSVSRKLGVRTSGMHSAMFGQMSSAVQHNKAGGSRANCTEKSKDSEEWVVARALLGPLGSWGCSSSEPPTEGIPSRRSSWRVTPVWATGRMSPRGSVHGPPLNSGGGSLLLQHSTCPTFPSVSGPPAESPAAIIMQLKQVASTNPPPTNHQRNPTQSSLLPPSARTQGCPSPLTYEYNFVFNGTRSPKQMSS